MFSDLSDKELKTLKAIRNHLVHHGRTPSVRDLMKAMGYKSPRSAAVLLEMLTEKEVLSKKEDGSFMIADFKIQDGFGTRAQTVNIPLLGNVACGAPIFAEENVEAEVSVSVELLKSGHKYFFLRADGDSMNKAGINGGDLVLIRQQQTAQNGDMVVALIDDEATIKEFYRSGSTIVMKPNSDNSRHQPIILTSDFRIQGVVEEVIKI